MATGMINVQRRNGKLQSCEPCRARKLACDHRVPCCGRCLRVGRGAKCHYQPPAPTKLKLDDDTRTSAGPLKESRICESASSMPDHRYDRFAGKQPSKLNTADSGDNPYFGQSSSFAAIAELNGTLGRDLSPTPASTIALSIGKVTSRWKLNAMQRLLNTDRLGRLMDRWFSVRSGYLIYHPVYRIWLSETRKMSKSAPNGEHAQDLCAMVDRNTEIPLSSAGPPTAQEWAHQCSGPRLRWETVGLMFCAVGLMAGSFSQWDPVFVSASQATESRWDLAKAMLELVDECIGFCRDAGSCNDLLAVLLFESTLLLERVQGCSSAAAWLRMGETCDMAIMLGFHKQKRVNTVTPFYLCELRIRLMQQMYSHDKFLATYLGRPPRLTYRHCAVQLAHDIGDDEICSGSTAPSNVLPQKRQAESDTICRSRAFWRRLWVPHAIIREDILEIALGTTDEDLHVRVREVRARIEKAHREMPDFLRIDVIELWQRVRQSPSGRALDSNMPWEPLDLLCTLGHHCGLRHTDFMLERAIIDRLTPCKDRLIESARDLLDLVLKVLQMRDYFRDFQADLVILLTYHAMPAASFLAIELLRQDQSSDNDTRLPRSCLIQQLSTLVSDAEILSPDDGNYRICKIGTTAIQQVLDRLLSLPRREEPPDLLHNFDAIADWDAFFTSSNDADALEWLDGFDFTSDILYDPSGATL